MAYRCDGCSAEIGSLRRPLFADVDDTKLTLEQYRRSTGTTHCTVCATIALFTASMRRLFEASRRGWIK
jgi:hypothetical protein